MNRDKKIVVIVYFAILSLSMVYYFVNQNKRRRELKKSVIVTAIVTRFFVTKGPVEVDVDYQFEGKLIHNKFYTYDIDTLERNEKVKLLIARDYPDKYIQCLGAAK